MKRRRQFGVTHTHTHTHTRRPCKDGGRHWSDAATSQGMTKIVGNHQKLERGNRGFLPRAFGGSMVLPLT